ncbi:MAG: glucosylceramidase [Paludibacteraceae bacterium]|nr:glucosylceramidase [Paludibacteraceae bacterium]
MRKFVNMRYLLLLSLAALLMTGCKDPNTNPGTDPTVTPTQHDVMTYITTADNTMHFDKVGKNFSEGLNMNPEITLTLDTKTRYQVFDGFGAAITGASAYNLSRMPADARAKLLKETFSVEEGMGYSYVRVPIGGSDFNVHSNYDYTCCDAVGIEHFALTSDETDYIIPILKEILAINPQLKVMGSPWSCPRWMKVSDVNTKGAYNSWVGGYLNPDYYQDYAKYFVYWIQSFESLGVPIESVTVENEPLNWGNSMSLYMPWQQQRDFVKTALGPAFAEFGLKTKIIVFDHNYNYDGKEDQNRYPVKIYNDSEAAQYIDGAAYHNYGGNASELENVHKAAPEKNLYFTEASIGTWNNGDDMSVSLLHEMKYTCLANVTRWCKSVIVWNFMLDDNNGPHGGSGACSTCFGAVDVSSKDYTTLTKRSHYYAIGHLSKAFKTGSTRIGVKGYQPTNVTVCAAENPDGTYGVVLMNENDNGLTMQVEAGERYFSLTLPGKSITTCVIPK